MRARYIIEGERWQEMKGQSTFDNIEELFALGLSAVNLGDAARVATVIAEFRKAAALDLFARGRSREAFVMLDRAVALQARMPMPIGRPFPVKDANELYGDLLLQ